MHGVVAELALLGVGLTADHPGDLLALVSPGVVHDGVDIHFFSQNSTSQKADTSDLAGSSADSPFFLFYIYIFLYSRGTFMPIFKKIDRKKCRTLFI